MPSKFQESAWLVYHYSGEPSMSVISRSRRRSRTADVHLALHGQNRDGNYQRVTATMKTDPVSPRKKPVHIYNPNEYKEAKRHVIIFVLGYILVLLIEHIILYKFVFV